MFKNKVNLAYFFFFIFYFIFSILLIIANESKIDLFNKYIQNKDYLKAQEVINDIKKSSEFDALIAQMILYAYKDNNLDNSKKVLKILKQRFVDNLSNPNQKNLNFSKILYNWAYILYNVKKDIYQSEATVNEALKYNSNNIDAIILLAKINYDKNNLDNSENLLANAYELALAKNYSDIVNLVSIYTDILL